MNWGNLLTLLLVVFIVTLNGVKSEWDYDPCGHGPSTWGHDYPICASGTRQSPIDLIEEEFVWDPDLPPLSFNWKNGLGKTFFNGEACQTNVLPNSMYVTGGPLGNSKYYMTQFHTHQVSEHHKDGLAYPMEIHFVHKNATGSLAVVGFFFRIGPSNSSFVGDFINFCNSTQETSSYLGFNSLLTSEDMPYITYPGSLTTPPCSEGVTWIVINQIFYVTRAQLEEFLNYLPAESANNRPLQHTNERVIRKYVPPSEETNTDLDHLESRVNTIRRMVITVVVIVAIVVIVLILLILLVILIAAILFAIKTYKLVRDGKHGGKKAQYVHRSDQELKLQDQPTPTVDTPIQQDIPVETSDAPQQVSTL